LVAKTIPFLLAEIAKTGNGDPDLCIAQGHLEHLAGNNNTVDEK